MTLIKDYLSHTEKWVAEYGEKTLVLMQVGSFYEAYGLLDGNNKIYGSRIEHFSEVCEMAISRKKMCVGKIRVVMAGFGLEVLDKYIRKLQAVGYTIPVYKQDTQAKNTTRSLATIYSPGTFFNSEAQELSNNTTCVWIHRSGENILMKENICIGLANIDIFTGTTSIFQFSTEFYHHPSTYDELERFMAVYRPNEVIIISNIKNSLLDDIINFTNIEGSKVHKIDIEGESDASQRARNSEKQKYQQKLISQYYPNSNEEAIFNDFYNYSVASGAFFYLLDHVNAHNPNLVSRLTLPIFENCSDRLILANHSLRQLNIIDDGRHKGEFRSVSTFLNNCVTVMGRRKFAYDLANPTSNIETLTKSYDITEHLLGQEYSCEEGSLHWKSYRKMLDGIKDIEKLRRKLILKKITPKDFYLLYESISIISKIYVKSQKDLVLAEFIKESGIGNIEKASKSILKYINKYLDLSKCKNIDDITVGKLGALEIVNIFFIKKGQETEIDKKFKNCLDCREQLECIRGYFSDVIKPHERSKKCTQYVKIHETAKSEATLTGTSRRISILKKELEKVNSSLKGPLDLVYVSKFTKLDETLTIDLNNISYISNYKKDMCINSSEIKNITSAIQSSKDILLADIILFYNKFIADFIQFEERLGEIIRFTTLIDSLQCKCYIAEKYNYCKPEIEKAEKSYIEFKGLRHCLIEHIQTSELYVPNDISLGKVDSKMDGILLYGTNAVGKTSLMRAIGIAVIMAQAGLYTPCTQCSFSPYEYIFTRIIANDNLFRGLSTFATEMSELRTILKLANKNSLILGDELCSGTETGSALSIFMTGLERLHHIECSFLFATHFHEIKDYEEVTNLENLKLKHMTVIYDRSNKTLVYDRLLKDGAGESMYGLEVCKALELPQDFLNRCHELRVKYNPQTQSVLTLDASHFNAHKLRGNCEVCENKIGTEVHHLQFQKHANKTNGYINYFHKNHPANLLNICEECHLRFHEDETQRKKIKTSTGIALAII